MPVLALGGGESFGRRELTLESMRRVADDVQGGEVEGSGHFIPEEKPEELVAALLEANNGHKFDRLVDVDFGTHVSNSISFAATKKPDSVNCQVL